MKALFTDTAVPFYGRLNLQILVRTPPRGVPFENLPDPFLSLPRMDPTGRWLLGILRSDVGQGIKYVTLRILRDSLTLVDEANVSNRLIERLWQNERDLRASFDGLGSFQFRFGSFENQTGVLIKRPPLLFCKKRLIFFIPVCPYCGGRLSECRDDELLSNASLELYSNTIKRYLYCADCSPEGKHRPAFFTRDVTPTEQDNPLIADRFGLIRLWVKAKEMGIDPKIFPCNGCDNFTDCYPEGEKLGNAARILYPFSFFNFFVTVHNFAPLNLEEFCDLLGGMTPSELRERAAETRNEVGIRVAQMIEERANSQPFYFRRAGAVEEILALKVSLFHEVATLVQRAWKHVKSPLMTLSPENFAVFLDMTGGLQPLYWSSKVEPTYLLSVPKEESMSKASLHSRSRRASPLGPLFVARPEYMRADSTGARSKSYGNLLITSSDRGPLGSGLEIRGSLKVPSSLTSLEDASLMEVSFGFEQGFSSPFLMVFRVEKTTSMGVDIVSLPSDVAPEQEQHFRFLTTQPPFEVTFRVLPSYGIDLDLYSLGLIGLRCFFSNKHCAFEDWLEQLRDMKIPIKNELGGKNLPKNWFEMLTRHGIDRQKLDIGQVLFDARFDDSLQKGVEEVWYDVINLIFSLIFSSKGYCYLADPGRSNEEVWSQVLDDAANLRRKALGVAGGPVQVTSEPKQVIDDKKRSDISKVLKLLLKDLSWLEPKKEAVPLEADISPGGIKDETLTIDNREEKPGAPPPPISEYSAEPPSLDKTIVLPSSARKVAKSQGGQRPDADMRQVEEPQVESTIEKKKDEVLLDETVVIRRKPKKKGD